LALCAFIPVAARLALIPILGVPEPANSDEFVHLLNGDIFSRGRLAMPSHPASHFLETIYVLQRPSYAGKYPPGQGLVLALGMELGHPWIGVLISGLCTGGAIFWFLSLWFPSRWAFAAALLCGLRWLTFSYWLGSYFGGPLTAFGALLLAGSILRWLRRPSLAMAMLAGIGWSCIWLVRPFESLAVLFVVAVAMLVLAVRHPHTEWRASGRLWPGMAVIIACLAFTGLHNYRVTGSAVMLPYQEAQRQYGVPQNPLFLPAVPDPGPLQKNLRDVYLWQLDARSAMLSWPRGLALLGQKPWFAAAFFVGPVLLFLLVSVWDSGGRRRRRISLFFAALLLFPSVTYVFAAPHYVAALAPFAAYSVADVLFRFCRSPFGVPLRRKNHQYAIVLAVGALSLMDLLAVGIRVHKPNEFEAYRTRRDVINRLVTIPGDHLVLVNYGPGHVFGEEWVYNSADVDGSRIVWAMDPGNGNRDALLRMFQKRSVWLLHADSRPVQLHCCTN
jgi:hypothetical protein